MKIHHRYSFSNNRQIWRLLPAGADRIIIEERNPETKEAFFSCLDIESGEKVFDDLQLREKYWTGIETIYKDIIYFHNFVKPDLPGHLGIIAYDINKKKIIWENPELTFLLMDDDKIYCFQSLFEVRKYYTLDYKTGIKFEELGSNPDKINELREKKLFELNFSDFKFPRSSNYIYDSESNIKSVIDAIKASQEISGHVEFVEYKKLLLVNFHKINNPAEREKFANLFQAIEIDSEKVIFEKVLNEDSVSYSPDSFFTKGNLIFLLVGKKELAVCAVDE
jgi:Domain of unknown function (DUF4905)